MITNPRRIPRCPKCRARPVSFTEYWRNHIIDFDVDSFGRPEHEGICSPGEPCCVYAACDCGHSWRLRGVRQITELQNPEDPPE